MKYLISLLLGIATVFVPTVQIIPPSDMVSELHGTVFLTFDDGPTDSTTPKILDVLKQNNVHATFFVIGKQIQNREEILKRINREGHTIGIHTYTHDYQTIYASEQAVLKDIEACKHAIRTVLPDWNGLCYRFPGGATEQNKRYLPAIRALGLTVYGWNASVDDAVLPRKTPEQLFQNAVQSAGEKNRIILLLHDGVRFYSTVECLPKIIRYYKSRNYVFRSL